MPRSGVSRMQYEGEWYLEHFDSAIVTTTRLGVDIATTGETGEPDVVTITAFSTDNGRIFTGTYRYKAGSYDPGQVEFTRERRAGGTDFFRGRWIDPTGPSDTWILEVDPADLNSR